MTDKEIVQSLRRLASKYAFTGHYGNEEILRNAANRLEELAMKRGELDGEELSDQ